MPLAGVLSGLYNDIPSIRRVAREAGMSLSHLDLSGSAADIWSAILEEAQKHDDVYRILLVATRQYPENDDLIRAEKAYQKQQDALRFFGVRPDDNSGPSPGGAVQRLQSDVSRILGLLEGDQNFDREGLVRKVNRIESQMEKVSLSHQPGSLTWLVVAQLLRWMGLSLLFSDVREALDVSTVAAYVFVVTLFTFSDILRWMRI